MSISVTLRHKQSLGFIVCFQITENQGFWVV